MSVEFVDQAKAEALGAEFVALATASDGAKVDSWFVMQAVADQVGYASNVGIRGISWSNKGAGGRPVYRLSMRCRDGAMTTSMAAPPTIEEAREPDALGKATAMLERKIVEWGGRTPRAENTRPHGTQRALVAAVGATEQGRLWIGGLKAPGRVLLKMVNVADGYGRAAVNPKACVEAHVALMPFDDRAELIREFPTADAARAKAMSLRTGKAKTTVAYPRVTGPAVKTMAKRTGTTKREARVVMQAALDGRSERKLVRLAREAVRWAETQVAA